MSSDILTDEQQKLLDILKSKQREMGEEKKAHRVVPKTVTVFASELANSMWGRAGDAELNNVLALFSQLVAAKVGIRLMRTSQALDEGTGQMGQIIFFRYSPVGKEKMQKITDAQKALGRKRRQIYASDEEWELAVKAIEDFRKGNPQLKLSR